jgi:hypothetical protein
VRGSIMMKRTRTAAVRGKIEGESHSNTSLLFRNQSFGMEKRTAEKLADTVEAVPPGSSDWGRRLRPKPLK